MPQGKELVLSLCKRVDLWPLRANNCLTRIWVFALFSSCCEQKGSAYMPCWALQGMKAVLQKVRKKMVKLLIRIKQKTTKNYKHNNKTKNKETWINITNVLSGLIAGIQRYTKEKRTWVPSLSKGRLLRPSTDCSPYKWKVEMGNERTQAYPL